MMATELQQCERCGNESNLETCTRMDDCWYCAACTADFQKHFDACDHRWTPHTDSMGDDGQYCERCCGFVRNEDMADIAALRARDGGRG